VSYAFFQCPDVSCRFRFPAAVDAAPPGGYECPHCGSSAVIAHGTTVAASDREASTPVAGPDDVDVPHLELLLDNIRSVGNVGSLFRTADGAGVCAVHLAGITATPEHERFAKSALGVPLPWEHRLNGAELALDLKRRGYMLWALEETPEADDIFEVGRLPVGHPTVLVLGNEVLGVDPEILAQCDRVVSIPMVGIKRSLNVVVACGIAAYVLLHGRQGQTGT